jgi:hypothetical protein
MREWVRYLWNFFAARKKLNSSSRGPLVACRWGPKAVCWWILKILWWRVGEVFGLRARGLSSIGCAPSRALLPPGVCSLQQSAPFRSLLPPGGSSLYKPCSLQQSAPSKGLTPFVRMLPVWVRSFHRVAPSRSSAALYLISCIEGPTTKVSFAL